MSPLVRPFVPGGRKPYVHSSRFAGTLKETSPPEGVASILIRDPISRDIRPGTIPCNDRVQLDPRANWGAARQGVFR
jgi:hypothetical protein